MYPVEQTARRMNQIDAPNQASSIKDAAEKELKHASPRALEWATAEGHGKQGATKGPDIDAFVDHGPGLHLGQFRRAVGRAADDRGLVLEEHRLSSSRHLPRPSSTSPAKTSWKGGVVRVGTVDAGIAFPKGDRKTNQKPNRPSASTEHTELPRLISDTVQVKPMHPILALPPFVPWRPSRRPSPSRSHHPR